MRRHLVGWLLNKAPFWPLKPRPVVTRLWYTEARGAGGGGGGGGGVLTFTRVENQRGFLSPTEEGSLTTGGPIQREFLTVCPLLHLLTQSPPLRERKHSLKATWLWTWLRPARQTAPSMGRLFTLRCEKSLNSPPCRISCKGFFPRAGATTSRLLSPQRNGIII